MLSERPSQAEIASSYNKRLADGTALGADLAGLTPRASGLAPLTIHPAVAPAAIGGPSAVDARLPGVAPIAATAAASKKAQEDVLLAGVDKSYGSADPTLFGTPIGDANHNLTAQIALMRVQADTFGETTGAITAATKAQELLNTYMLRGTPISSDLSRSIADYGARTGKGAQDQEDLLRGQKQAMDIEDAMRGGLAGAVSSGFTGLVHGQGFRKSFNSGLSGLGDRLIGIGTNDIFGSLFGQQGKGLGTGLFGGLLSNLHVPEFAGSTVNAPGGPTIVGEAAPELVQMPAHAQVMTAAQTSGLMGARSSAMPQLPAVAVHIHPVGGAQFTPDQVQAIRGQVSQGVQDGHAELMRTYSQFHTKSVGPLRGADFGFAHAPRGLPIRHPGLVGRMPYQLDAGQTQ